MSGTVESVDDFVDRWVKAEWRGDVTELAVLLDQDFVALPTNTPMLRKADWLRRYQRADLVHTDLNWSTTMTIRRQNFSIVTGSLRQTSSSEGRDASAAATATLVVDLDPSPRLLALFIDAARRQRKFTPVVDLPSGASTSERRGTDGRKAGAESGDDSVSWQRALAPPAPRPLVLPNI